LSTIPSSYLPSYLTSYLNGTSGTASGQGTGGSGSTASEAAPIGAGTGDSAATVSLSDEAKAFLAATGTTATPALPPGQSARAWLDEQYKKLGITSPTPEGKPALDLAALKREELAAVVANTDKKFSEAEQTASATELDKRFATAMTAHIAIARSTGNYAGLYQAAADYLDQAGADERASETWKDDKKGVTDGLAAAKATKGSAPDTDPAKDPIRAMLDRRTAAATSAGASAETVAKNARAMLDDQANHASDAGTRLVFDKRQDGQMVDFTPFSNRALASIALNKDDTFTSEEANAAKTALNERTRATMLGVLNPSSGSANGGDINLGLIRTYENMSAEEKAVLGVTDAVTDRLIQNFQTLQSLQSAFAGGGNGMFGLSAAMLAYNNANNSRADESMASLGLSGLL
jgi:hypothetical protein